MNCPYCGAAPSTEATFCTNCGAFLHTAGQQTSTASVEYSQVSNYSQPEAMPILVPKRSGGSDRNHHRNKPPLALRLPLQILSGILSMVLTVCLIATALLMDVNSILSAGGIKQIISAVFTVSQPASARPRPIAGALGGIRLDDSIPDIGDLENIELPADALANGNTEALVEWISDLLEETVGQEVNVDPEQIADFVNNSTITDYLSEKAAGYAEDFINDTQLTQITTEELMQLLEENQSLIESTFQVEITPETKQSLSATIEKTIVENDLNNVIHEQVLGGMEESLDAALPNVDMATIRQYLQTLTSEKLMMGAIAVCIAIMLLLCLINFYNLPAGLTWSAVPCIVAGGLLSLPVLLLQASPTLLTDLVEMPETIPQLITSLLQGPAAIHFGMLLFGIILLVLSIIWRIVRSIGRNG